VSDLFRSVVGVVQWAQLKRFKFTFHYKVHENDGMDEPSVPIL
jgi:hypothetical protein